MPLIDSSQLFRPSLRPLYRPFQAPLEGLLGLAGINRLYEACKGGTTEEFSRRCLAYMGLDWDFPEAEIQRLKKIEGPLIVVANHPLGGPEAVLLHILLGRIRADYRLMANFVLGMVPEVAPKLILVDPFDGKDAKARNLAPLRESLQWLKGGGLLGVFPAGEVSSLDLGSRRVRDKAWQPGIAALALKSRATVLPLYFEGRNSWVFQAAGLVSPRLRTLMLPRTTLKPAPKALTFQFGNGIPVERLTEIGEAEKLSRHLYECCYSLAAARPLQDGG